jgi:hypothetical protein
MPYITCNGFSRTVTRNLFDALKALRYADKTRLLWVDALCINQDDTIDRTTQVNLMAEIYKNALRTVVWLGPATSKSILAMDMLDRLKNASQLWILMNLITGLMKRIGRVWD